MEMTQNDFLRISSYIYDISGITMPPEKEYLLKQKLEKLVKQYNCSSYSEFANLLRNNQNSRLKEDIIDAITINETSFFRDDSPFKVLYDFILPQFKDKILEAKRNKTVSPNFPIVRILSAGSSTGQEIYSIAMTIKEYVAENKGYNLSLTDFSIIGVDISSEVLIRAKEGRYSNFEISRGLNALHINKFFNQVGQQWEVKDDLKKIVRFEKVNLNGQFSYLGSFDIIFCRNVLIYFDNETKNKIINQFYNMLHTHSFLFLGSTEGMSNFTDKFKTHHIGNSIIYIKK